MAHFISENQHIISGHVEQNVKVRRTLDDKFYIPYYVYANSIYPDYTSGRRCPPNGALLGFLRDFFQKFSSFLTFTKITH